MATRASIAARKEIALQSIADRAIRQGSHDAEKRLQQARASKGRDPATRGDLITANLLEAIDGIERDGEKRNKRNSAPIEEIKALSPKSIAAMRERGILTKGDVYQTPDFELLKLPGIAPETLRRIRAQL